MSESKDDLAARLAKAGLLSHERGQPYVALTLDALDLIIQLVETADAIVSDEPANHFFGMDRMDPAERVRAIDRYLGIRKQVFGA